MRYEMMEIERKLNYYLKGTLEYDWQLSEDRTKEYDMLQIRQRFCGSYNVFTIVLDLEHYDIEKIKKDIEEQLLMSYLVIR